MRSIGKKLDFYQPALSKELIAAVCLHLYFMPLGCNCVLTELALSAFGGEELGIFKSHATPYFSSL